MYALSEFVRDFCKRHLVPITQRPDFEEWLASTSYNEVRKEELRRAHDANRGACPPARVCKQVKTFIKLEDYPEYKHARWINSRCDRFKVFCGPYFKKIEEQVYDVKSDIKFIKHVPVPDRPQAIEALPKGLRYYGTDYTSFEKHFTKHVMNSIEFVLYDYMLPCMTPLEKKCLFSTLAGFNKLRSRSGFKATVEARRMSGEMCTSLGNGFTNLILTSYIAHLRQGHVYGFVEGDDGLFATDFELSPEDYSNLGFEIKIIPYEKIGDASFCGMIFSESGEIIRNPVEFLAKFSWTSSCMGANEKVLRELLRAKALSCVYETPQCPIVGAAARYALDMTRDSAARFVFDGYHEIPRDQIHVAEFDPKPSTRVQFEKLFHISVSDQIRIEQQLSSGNFDVAHLMPLSRDHLHYCTRYVANGE